jgi:DNA-binding response OmpR family regulator
MGLAAAPDRRTASLRDAREDFLRKLEGCLDDVSARVEALAGTEDIAETQRPLCALLKGLAADAAQHGPAQLAEELHAARAIVEGAGVLGVLGQAERRQLVEVLARIGGFVRAELERSGGVQPPMQPRRRSRAGSVRITLCGPRPMAESLLAEDWVAEDDSPALTVERLDDMAAVHRSVRARKPEALVVDADMEGCKRLVERIVADRATEDLAIVVVGSWERIEQAAPYVALGVAKVLPKPAAPGELRRACLEAAPRRGAALEPIGSTSIDKLGRRLAEELQRGLCDSAESRARDQALELGDGADLLTVLWDAIGRIREIVTLRTHGVVRFNPTGPLAALPKSNWLAGVTRRAHSRSGSLNEVREATSQRALVGATLVVAEDDPSMNWFLSGVLAQAGAAVMSAYDGRRALDHAYRTLPDLVLSDVVMPGLDGFGLCRAVKQDVLLRSVPVVLMSWKQDLLQRMRELGAGADGYLKKDATTRELLQRVEELLRPRRALGERLAQGGVVHGRLDGLTPHALLKLVCRLRPDARLSVRDAYHGYEIEIRSGRPVLATRTDAADASERGPAVIAALIGVGGGRFTVAPVEDGSSLAAELEGSLDEQLLEPIARARAAQRLLSGAALVRIERVRLDAARMGVHLRATPEPSRGILRALIGGASPAELVSSGSIAADLLERVLCDAARQGAVLAIFGHGSGDLLPGAFDREIAILSGQEDPGAPLAEPVAWDERWSDDPPEEEAVVSSSGPVAEVAPPTPALPASEDDDPLLATLVAGDESPEPTPVTPVPRPRNLAHTPLFASATSDPARHTPVLSKVAAAPATLAELAPVPVPVPVPAPAIPEIPPPPPPPAPAPSIPAPEEPRVPRAPLPSAWTPRAPEAPKKSSARFVLPILFGVVGIGLAVGARWLREQQPAPVDFPPPPAMPQPHAPPAAPGPAAPTADEPTTTDAVETEQPEELPLTDKQKKKLADGQGILEIVAGKNDEVVVDGKSIGKGVVQLPLAAREEPYEIRVRMRGEERVRYAVVKEGARMRVRIAPPWQR